MMKINLNLLPEKKQKKIEHLLIFIFIKRALESTIIVCVLISLVLLWSWMALVDEFKNLSESSTLINRSHSSYNKEIRDINRDINLLQKSNQDIDFSIIKFSEMANNLPEDIKINYLSLDLNNKKIVINGTAKTRDSLLNYQEKLKEIEWMGETEVPTSQLFKKEDINFNFETAIKL